MFDGITAPQIIVEVAWTTASPNTGSGSGFVLDAGILGTNTLGGDNFWTDITDDVQSLSIRRGRSREFSDIETGTMSLVLDNSTGDYDPTNLSGRFVVGGVTQVKPLKQIRVTAIWLGISYYLYRGYVEDFDIDLNEEQTTLSCVDALSFLGQQMLVTTAGVGAGELTSARVTRILDAAGFPSSLRAIETGQENIVATTYGDYALNLLNETARTEAGVFFVAANGYVTFHDRHQRYVTLSGSPTLALTDAAGAVAEYFDIQVQYGASQIGNVFVGSRSGGSNVTVSDSTSVTNYGARTPSEVNVSGLGLQTDAEVTDYLTYVLFKYKDPDLRVSSVKINALTLPDQYPGLLSLELQKTVSVSRSYSGVHTLSKTLFVEGIDIDITPESWQVALTTSSSDRDGRYAPFDTGQLDTMQLAF